MAPSAGHKLLRRPAGRVISGQDRTAVAALAAVLIAWPTGVLAQVGPDRPVGESTPAGLPPQVLRYQLHATSRDPGSAPATRYRYVSATDTIDVTVYPNVGVTARAGLATLTVDRAAAWLDRDLRGAVVRGTIARYEVPIRDTVSCGAGKAARRSHHGRRAVAVVRSPTGVISVLYSYDCPLGASIVQVRASVPSAGFDNTDVGDFIDRLMQRLSANKRPPAPAHRSRVSHRGP